ncbi:MAG: hypothetical protein C0593_00965 [Marinilabiliales bacterium]|nr:MAG: hypothetical protein C0593_00965 [Marinilabiliales bacterium]
MKTQNRIANQNFKNTLDLFLGIKSDEVQHSTFQKYQTWKKTLLEYEGSLPGFFWTEETLNCKHLLGYEEFLKYIKHLKPNTVSKYNKCFITFLSEMYPKVDTSCLAISQVARKPVSITEDELEHLIHLSLKKSDAEVRDIFVMLCLTGMEYKDFLAYNWQNISDVIEYNTNRRNRKAIVPLDKRMLPIIDRYNGQFTKYSEPYLNRKLKAIFRANGYNRLVSEHTDKEPYAPLHDKITLGIGRHTFIQHVINNRATLWDIMHMTGVHDIEKLSRYDYPKFDYATFSLIKP